MTVVPAEKVFSMICDGCGDTVTGAAHVLPDAEVVWTLVLDNGWSGSAFAAGPHRCPRCSLRDRLGGHESEPEDLLGIGAPDAQGDHLEAEVDAAEPVRRALSESLVVGSEVLVDLGEVTTIDSVGLGLLVRAHQEARREQRTLCLVAPSRFVLTVLHTMRLEPAFPVFPTRAAAFRQRTGPAARIGPVQLKTKEAAR